MKPVLLLLCLTAIAAGAPQITRAARPALPDLAVPIAQDVDSITLDQAVERVRRLTGGRVLDAYVRDENGRRTYVIKVLTPGGHIRIFDVDARTGRIGR